MHASQPQYDTPGLIGDGLGPFVGLEVIGAKVNSLDGAVVGSSVSFLEGA